MLVGLIADTHDAREPTIDALERLDEAGAELLLHAGDLITGRTVPLLDGWTTWLARGNADWPESIEEAIDEHACEIRYATRHEIELEGARIGLVHGEYDGVLEGMIAEGTYDVVVHGHTHRFRDERVEGTRVINPGAVWRTRSPSVCLYDTVADELERIELDW